MNMTSRFIQYAVYPAMKRWRGNRVMDRISELQHHETMNRSELRELQKSQLQSLLKHALTHVPAYKEFQYLLNELDNPFYVLREIPLLTKQSFRPRRDDFLSDTADTSSIFLNRSGGSTGEPVTFYMNRHAVEYSEAARWRGLSWWGIRPWDPCLMVWGSPIELKQSAMMSWRLKERWLKNRVLIPAFALQPERMLEYRSLIESFQPVYLYGWPSSMEILARGIQATGQPLRLHRIKGIVSTAEVLTDAQRKLLQEVFGAPVINEYGAREGGIMGYECPQGNMHASVDNTLMEVVDPQTGEMLPEGKTGFLVVTDLHNYVMPRLRYRLGDMVQLSSEFCSCGRTLPLIRSVDGREDDTFLRGDGLLVNGQYFTNIARLLPSIQQFQIEQVSVEQMILRLKDNGQLNQQDISAFCQQIKDKMGDIQISVERLAEIHPAASGKMRVAIRSFPLPTALKSSS
ncbi:phenylacetate--CoA ligase family protein [Alicyclobacillus tolerans]|uniref:Phenylacetate-CoA ligase n=1 Tax=Alicyclobacillus tolerans TaxID=90970 RepID=A0ABT9LV77_9BACL|nr:AMP-binding protein [Alicyclobacillus tengchongensis]MDP9728183.1 phenylacetate-CoA ligase [Alicyclobacillus tengchongensis]